MAYYLLSVHSVAGEVREPMSEEQMRQLHEQLGVIEEELKSGGAWLFSGRLHEPDTATVVRVSDGDVQSTNGPFVAAKGHLGGFYIVEVADLDTALGWAARVTAIIKAPIEVRPFADVRR